MSTSKFKVGDIVRVAGDHTIKGLGLSKAKGLLVIKIEAPYSAKHRFLYFKGEEHPYGGLHERCFEIDIPDKPIKFSSIDKTGMNLKGVLDLYTELSNKNLILPE